MDEGQWPSGGWFWAALAAAALLGRALDMPVRWLGSLLGLKSSADEARLKRIAEITVREELERQMSATRQALTEKLAGHTAQISHHEVRITDAYAELDQARAQMIARDEELERAIRREIKGSMKEHEERMRHDLGVAVQNIKDFIRASLGRT